MFRIRHRTLPSLSPDKLLRHTLALASFLVLGAAATLPAATPVACRDTLEVPGHYELVGDLTCGFTPQLAAVTIWGDDVLLDLNGFTIRPDATGGAFLIWGIKAEGTRARITGGRVTGFTCPGMPPNIQELCAGVSVGLPEVSVSGMTLDHNRHGVLVAETFPGFFPSDTQLTGSLMTNNLGAGVLVVAGSSGTMIKGNEFNENLWGVASNSSGATIVGNTASGNSDAGFALFDLAHDNLLRGNVALDNGRAGIAVGADEEENRAYDNLIQGNEAFGNATDLFDGMFDQETTTCLNTWRGNDFGVARPLTCIR